MVVPPAACGLCILSALRSPPVGHGLLSSQGHHRIFSHRPWFRVCGAYPTSRLLTWGKCMPEMGRCLFSSQLRAALHLWEAQVWLPQPRLTSCSAAFCPAKQGFDMTRTQDLCHRFSLSLQQWVSESVTDYFLTAPLFNCSYKPKSHLSAELFIYRWGPSHPEATEEGCQTPTSQVCRLSNTHPKVCAQPDLWPCGILILLSSLTAMPQSPSPTSGSSFLQLGPVNGLGRAWPSLSFNCVIKHV